MSDIVVCVPKALWYAWLAEGALPGEPVPDGIEYHWFGGSLMPKMVPGERVYIAAHGRLRGYAPVVRVETRAEAVKRWCAHADVSVPVPSLWWWPYAKWALVRQGGAVAVTIPEPIRGVPAWRKRWWEYADEIPFPDWQTDGVPQARQGVLL